MLLLLAEAMGFSEKTFKFNLSHPPFRIEKGVWGGFQSALACFSTPF